MFCEASAVVTGWCRRLAGLGLLVFWAAILTPSSVLSHDHDANCSGKGKGHGHHRDGSVHCQADSAAPTIAFDSPSPSANGNGWNNTDVTISFTVTDEAGGSGVGTVNPASPLTFTSEGANQTRSVTACDLAGNCATAVSPAVSIDKTAPSIAASGSPAPNAAGWNNTNVTVSFSASDSLSGIDSVTGPTSLGEGAGQTASGVATDRAGNTASAEAGPFNIDLTPPSLTESRSPAANANGWNNSAVSVDFSCTDSLSGVASEPSDAAFSAEGAGQSASASCSDLAGNSSALTASGINIDLTAPSLAGTASPAPNAAGWNNTSVTVSFEASDALSGIDSVTGPTSLGEGAGQTASGVATDRAGNSATAEVGPINVDLTPPSLTASRSPAANANGWNSADVSIAYACTDSLSGVASVSPDETLTEEGAGQSRTGTCSDLAGNAASASVSDINIDKTAPSATCSASAAPNESGWYNADVTVTCSGADALSGIDAAASVGLGSTVLGEGAGQTLSATAADLAGNSASASAGPFNIDKTGPSIAGSQSPAKNANGWNNTDVTVSFACSDALSGLAAGSPPAPTVLTAEGVDQSASGSCSDLAGNSALATVSDIDIDKTAPSVSHADDYAPNANGWSATDVTVTFSAADGLSGLDGAASSNLGANTVGEGAAQTVSASASDLAGNAASDSAGPYNVDKTAPSIAGSQSPAENAQGWNNTDVTISFACSDALSGLAAGSPPAPTVLTEEGVDQSASGTCVDLAGNSASSTYSDVDIDRTAPTIAGERSPAANPNGWNNGDVTVSFACSDALSGLAAGSPPDPTILTEAGSNLFASGTCGDNAGNEASATVGGINIDKAIPTLTGLTVPSVVFFGANFSITANGTDPAPASGFTKAVISIVEWLTSKTFLHSFEPSVTDVWTQRATRLGKFTVKWLGYDGADNERDPDGEGGIRLPDTPGAENGAFFAPVDNSQYELGRTLPLKFKFVDVDGNPLPEFCGTVVMEQDGGVHRVLNAPWDGTYCRTNEQLDAALGYHEGALHIRLPRDDDSVLGYTRTTTIQIK